VTFTIDACVWVAAFERADAFHQRSVAFLRACEAAQTRLWAPAIVTLEVACALSRRARNPDIGDALEARLRSHPLLSLRPLNDELLSMARVIGTTHFLRAADALYAATSTLESSVLVTWDDELVSRINAVSPEQALRRVERPA
jgi:predicted nucleic acid-binding protein